MNYIKLLLCVLYCVLHLDSNPQISNPGREDVQNMQARSMFYSNVNGQAIYTSEAESFTDGSPFFKSEWMKAAAVLPNGKLSTYFPARINLLKGQVHYLDDKGKEFIATSPILELFMTDTVVGTKYHFVSVKPLNKDLKIKESWQQVLVRDSITLYKVIDKTLQEYTDSYASTMRKKKIISIEKYMIQEGNKAAVIKKTKELLSLYPKHREQLSAFIKANPEKEYLSVDQQFTEIINYLNTLVK